MLVSASVFIGPPPDVLRRVGDKTGAKLLAEQVGVPVAAVRGGPAGARHIEVQVVADDHGAVWAAGVRDCSVRRRDGTVIEESGSPALGAEQERELRAAAVDVARAVGYRNVGTVRFLYEPERRTVAFIEVDPHLQAGHPVTEVTTGLDLVKLQLHVAGGGHLEGEPPPASGHAIAAQLTAEDPEQGFAPVVRDRRAPAAALRAGGTGRDRPGRG